VTRDQHTGLKSDEGQGGAVTLIQRFASAANLNIHLHCLVLDGVYRCGADGASAFIEADAPTDAELDALLHTIIARLMKMLARRGVLVKDMDQTWLAAADANGEEVRTLRPLQAAAVTYRIAFGPRVGQKVLTLRDAVPREDRARQLLCTDCQWHSNSPAPTGGTVFGQRQQRMPPPSRRPSRQPCQRFRPCRTTTP